MIGLELPVQVKTKTKKNISRDMIGATNLDRRKAARVAAAVGTRLVPRPGHPNAASGAVAPETARGAEARRSRR